jgi:hypothetical protein
MLKPKVSNMFSGEYLRKGLYYKRQENGSFITNDRCEWIHAEKLVCPHKRWTGTRWAVINKDPCPTCKHPSCHNVKSKSDEWNRCLVVEYNKGDRGIKNAV